MHSTAIIGIGATIGHNVEIGPYSVIDDDVEVGDDCWIGNHVTLKAGTRIGRKCKIFHGAVIGEVPQDLKYIGEKTTVEIGENVVIREHVTINRGTQDRLKTIVGSGSFFMAYSHVSHDSIIGDNVIMANGVYLGGHVTVDDWVYVSGAVVIHQFCHIGKFVLVAGGYRVVQDVPPYILVAGEPLKYNGLNSVGLRRRGFDPNTRKLIKKAYKIIFNSSYNTSQAVREIKEVLPQTSEIMEITSFIENSKRGII
ncbi:MAG: acyl-ACP--UDP-N-acetylglucosamine O-acyltransferase [Candidatus Marinimicrobia bacterium]|nr:acyl-ACP--UDP-N-acetylglucosamine O-acyltransferase [Candidatus Neomarinimicrobiota bacterium]